MLCPYLLDGPVRDYLRDDLDRLIPIVKKLADEFADVYVPLDDILAEAMKTQPAPLYFSNDGVHPNQQGSQFIGKVYADYVKPLIK